ncbi:MAG: shikimate kinase [Pseudomonadota bacterium]
MRRIDQNLKREVLELLNGRSVVLVGLMGCGKSAIGRRLSQALDLPFMDADTEIEIAACKTVSEIFADHGERYFRDGERRVIRRLMAGRQHVLATGGGAFMDPRTRATIRDAGVSVWLRADLDVLVERVSRRETRPLLKGGNKREILQDLMAERNPIYGKADIEIESVAGSHEAVVLAVLKGLRDGMPKRSAMCRTPSSPLADVGSGLGDAVSFSADPANELSNK